MIKKLLIFFSLLFVFNYIYPHILYAQEGISLSNISYSSPVKYGDPVTVKFTWAGLEGDTDKFYIPMGDLTASAPNTNNNFQITTWVVPDCTARQGDANDDPHDPYGAAWSNISCQNNTFTGTFNTGYLMPQESWVNKTIGAFFGDKNVGSGFTFSDAQSAPFSVSSVSSSKGGTPPSAGEGDTLTIVLAKTNGDYEVDQVGGGNSDSIASQNCSGTCTITTSALGWVYSDSSIAVKDGSQSITLNSSSKPPLTLVVSGDEGQPGCIVCSPGYIYCAADSTHPNSGYCTNSSQCNSSTGDVNEGTSQTCTADKAICDHNSGCVAIPYAGTNPYDAITPTPPCTVDNYVTDPKSPNFGNCKSVATGLGFSINTDAGSFITSLLGVILSISGGIAVLLIIISGYRLMISQGNPEKIQAAREQLTAAIVGLLFIIFSLVIIQVLGYDILHIPGFGQ